MSRKDALNTFTLSAFKESMTGIFTTSVAKDTIDECPMVYKPMDEIISHVKETVTIEMMPIGLGKQFDFCRSLEVLTMLLADGRLEMEVCGSNLCELKLCISICCIFPFAS